MQKTLESWSQRCNNALAELEAQVEKVKKDAVNREKLRRKKEQAREAVLQASDDKGQGNKRGATGFSNEDAMDIDDESGSGSSRVTRNSKRGHGIGFPGIGRRLA